MPKVTIFARVKVEYDVECLSKLGCARDAVIRLENQLAYPAGTVDFKVIMIKDEDDKEVRGWEMV